MKNIDQYEDRIKQIKEKQKIYNREEIINHFTDLIIDRILCAYEYHHDSFEYPLHISLEKYNLINDYEELTDLWKDVKARVTSMIIDLDMKNKMIYNDSSHSAFTLYFTSGKTIQFGLQTNLGVKWNYES